MEPQVLQKLNDLTVVSGYEPVLADHALGSLDDLFAVRNDQTLSKPGLEPWRERLRLVLQVGGRERVFYLKRFLRPPRSVRRAVSRSGSAASSVAGVEWVWINRLAADGIPCVQPVALGEQLQGGRELRSAVLTEAVPGVSLEQWVAGYRDDHRATLHCLIPLTASLVAQLHRQGYIHRDLYLSHLFFDPSAPPERSLRLIDMQRVRRPCSRQRRWIIKDLASLNFSVPHRLISRTDRLRWLTKYRGARKLDASTRSLVYRIVGKTQQIERHERRRQARGVRK